MYACSCIIDIFISRPTIQSFNAVPLLVIRTDNCCRSIYAARMMTLTQVYSFWRHVTNLERQESKEYLDVLYKLLLRPIMARSEGGAERAN